MVAHTYNPSTSVVRREDRKPEIQKAMVGRGRRAGKGGEEERREEGKNERDRKEESRQESLLNAHL